MSENIFSNFYNKVLSFFQKDKNDSDSSSKDTATNRLKLVLMQDRSNLDGATMQKMREQLITVISRYIEIDQEALDLNLESDGDEIALMLNIPVIRARTREEIEEIEKAEEEAKAAAQQQKEDESEDEENTSDSEEKEDETSDTENEESNQENEENSSEDEQNSDAESESESESESEGEESEQSDDENSEDNQEDSQKSSKNKKKDN